ncbi:Stf0 family sulfotransferase [Alloyangia pacifica]|uniref:Stf0 family sulfotransferase n=1 Tax=Alloyangia pacifica TaxID=311180 RepID=UPI001CD4287C|nr:Stf0 family sulfotransferase [Alloyangia pacifica]MCA0998649.1 Stf0 sulfotransferase family protein [Alloyangia pacifica]
MKNFLKRRLNRGNVAPTTLQILSRPGGHERRLRDLYGTEASYRASGPAFDTPLVIVGFTNRSGSNLLVDYIRQAGKANGGGEYLNGGVLETMQAQHGFKRFPDYLRHLHTSHCVPEQSLMLKASWDQLAMLVRLNIPAMFPSVTVLHVQRGDLLAQAVSYSIALQTGQWSSRQDESEVEPVFDPDEILRSIESFQKANLLIDLICRTHGFPCFAVTYEQDTRKPEAVGQILHRAGLAASGWQPGPPRLAQQRDARNAAFEARFLEEVRKVLGGA